ncbi:MAG: hypothetical protein IPJ75_06265 [Ignavibacteriales bacterium]|nr:hypothetical protein [Ignavibacteriales bacterium]
MIKSLISLNLREGHKIHLVVMPDGNVHSFKKNGASVVHRVSGITGITKEGAIVFLLSTK